MSKGSKTTEKIRPIPEAKGGGKEEGDVGGEGMGEDDVRVLRTQVG